jgi:membrane-associated phospholipid phosphatase
MATLTSDAAGGGSPPLLSARDWPGARRALFVALAATLALVAVYLAFVQSSDGQGLDQQAVDHLAARLSSREAVADGLRGVTVGLVALVLLGCVAVAVARRRLGIGLVAVGIVIGANVTTEALKHVVFTRPHLGHGWDNNSLPSGHTTIVTSLALAALLVVPHAWRGLLSVAAAVAVAVAGVGTVVAGWHRPSDVVAAYAVCLAWGAIGLAAVSLHPDLQPAPVSPRAHPLALFTGLALAAAAFLEVGVRPQNHAHDLVVHVVVMVGIAVVGALVVGVFNRMCDARTG